MPHPDRNPKIVPFSAPGNTSADTPVFHDSSHRRAWWVKALLLTAFAAISAVPIILIATLLAKPPLPTGTMRPGPMSQATAEDPILEAMRTELGCTSEASLESCIREANGALPPTLDALPRDTFETYAFMPVWPASNLFSLEENLDRIDVLMPQIYSLELGGEGFTNISTDAAHMETVQHLLNQRRGHTRILPVLRIWTSPQIASHPIANPEAFATELATKLGDAIVAAQNAGLCLRLDDDDTRSADLALRLVRHLKTRADWANKRSCLIVHTTALSVWTPERSMQFDTIVLDPSLHLTASPLPHPLAPAARAETLAKTLSQRGDLDKFIVALGTRSADWTSAKTRPQAMSYVDAMAAIGQVDAQVSYSRMPSNSYSEFSDADGNVHTVWMQDATSAYPWVKHLSDAGITRFAIWPIGGEDPGLWSLLRKDQHDIDRLIHPDLQRYISYEGEGALIDYGHAAQPGLRHFTAVPGDTGRLDQRYLALPSPQHLIHWGKMPPNTLLLTFDDGPDPTYSPQVLDILKEKQVPATFFLIGGMMGRDPDTVRRMVNEGHIVGTHSYTHPDFTRLTPLRARLELALSQMMFKHITGRETYVMRLPYAAGTGPTDGRMSRPVKDVTDRGYILAMEDISPPDWAGQSANEIVAEVLDNTQSGEGKVLVLHDGGGPRANMVEALPLIIEKLRARGYRFIGMDELMGVATDSLMPSIHGAEPLPNRTAATVLSQLSPVLRWSFWAVIMIGIARTMIILVASHYDRWRRHYTINPKHPRVDVLVPAYCEETVVVATVNSVLASNYPDLHVIAIDDGSSDNTYDVLLEAFADHPNVTVLQKPNGGKSSALNYALAYSTADYFVAIDADTLIEPRAISQLVRHFNAPSVGAVAGNVKVGNRVNLLTRFQALEYITAQNIDRRAMELINGMLVVPGAIGAWRRKAVEAAGAYRTDTLAEDADLTVSVIRAGYKTAYEPNAIAITEAPETLRQFFRQRLRWSLGMLQMAWKHREAVRDKRGLGLFALPDLLIFGAIMPLLAPLADFVFLISLTSWISKALPGPHAYAQPPLNLIEVGAYLALPLLDVCIAYLAFKLEPGERKSLIALVLIGRFWYRQMLYISTIRALWQAITGRIGGWKKIARTSALVQAVTPIRLAAKPAEPAMLHSATAHKLAAE